MTDFLNIKWIFRYNNSLMWLIAQYFSMMLNCLAESNINVKIFGILHVYIMSLVQICVFNQFYTSWCPGDICISLQGLNNWCQAMFYVKDADKILKCNFLKKMQARYWNVIPSNIQHITNPCDSDLLNWIKYIQNGTCIYNKLS